MITIYDGMSLPVNGAEALQLQNIHMGLACCAMHSLIQELAILWQSQTGPQQIMSNQEFPRKYLILVIVRILVYNEIQQTNNKR